MRQIDWKAVLIAFVIMVVLQLIFDYLAVTFHIPVNANQQAIRTELQQTHHLSLIVVVILAPIMEEIVFRLKFFEFFGEFMSKWVGIVINGLVFMGVHSTDVSVVTLIYFTMGVILSYVYQRRGNLGDSISVHILNNLYASIF